MPQKPIYLHVVAEGTSFYKLFMRFSFLCLPQNILQSLALHFNSYSTAQNRVQGCHGQGKVREKQFFFKVREKSGNFVKVSEKSGKYFLSAWKWSIWVTFARKVVLISVSHYSPTVANFRPVKIVQKSVKSQGIFQPLMSGKPVVDSLNSILEHFKHAGSSQDCQLTLRYFTWFPIHVTYLNIKTKFYCCLIHSKSKDNRGDHEQQAFPRGSRSFLGHRIHGNVSRLEPCSSKKVTKHVLLWW